MLCFLLLFKGLKLPNWSCSGFATTKIKTCRGWLWQSFPYSLLRYIWCCISTTYAVIHTLKVHLWGIFSECCNICFFAVIHRADGPAGSRAVYRESMFWVVLLLLLLLFLILDDFHLSLLIYRKKADFQYNAFSLPCSNCSTSCVRRQLRAWWMPPSNLHWAHSGTSLMNRQQPAAILSKTRG